MAIQTLSKKTGLIIYFFTRIVVSNTKLFQAIFIWNVFIVVYLQCRRKVRWDVPDKHCRLKRWLDALRPSWDFQIHLQGSFQTKKCRFFRASSFWRWTSPGFLLTIRIVISSLAPGLIQAGRWRQTFQNFSDTFLVWWKSEKWISIFFYIKSSSQLDLVLQSEEGGDLSGFMPNGNNFLYLLSFIVYLGVSILIIHSHFMPKRYIFTISCFQVNGRCWACPEKGVRSSTPPGLSLMLTSPSQSRSGELFFYFYLLFLFHVIILSFFNLFKSWSKVKRAIYNSITGYIQTGGGRCTTSSIWSCPASWSPPWLCLASLFHQTLERNSL